jgi:transcriptional accessory protein Tex/SPT6
MEFKKYELEFIVNTSPKILYNFLVTPSGLSEWFSDDVNIRNDIYTFFWDGEETKAKLLTKRKEEYAKFQWVNEDNEAENENTYFEFKIEVDNLTNETALLVTDFAEEDELDSAEKLWESQIAELKHILGL